ncbi:hypothetical protein RO3G_02188 [Rhizopus delemar RA 99-880]|uniref:Uncharacterized protein n=1 Tax=Rhizopus delemar (strain RA 99-880 / ATCC MYA-4621 / FGSC 9543 / NRRL 43880) TaxID=246409 RepID=I1BMQ4_RHIO9|nr:hypothetical protein RO3G_02188 [Rhizopus delemar RA 99-880]|eukprot:EIE77484.1 hypothetical protein RO3G_02188 [Rhizopus delemar RA 99-880]
MSTGIVSLSSMKFLKHHWKKPGANQRMHEQEAKKLLDLKSYQAYRETLDNNSSLCYTKY